jgi:hypothetical protein
MAFNPFAGPKRPDAPSYDAAYQEASRQTAANAAAWRPQKVSPQDMKAQLAQKLAAWRAQPVGAGGRRALPVGTPQVPYQRVNPQDVYNQRMTAYQQQLADWQRQQEEWQRQQREYFQQQNIDYGGGSGGDGGSNFGGGGDSSAGGSPAGDGGGAMGGAMSRGGKVQRFSKGGMVSDSFSKMSRHFAKKGSM